MARERRGTRKEVRDKRRRLEHFFTGRKISTALSWVFSPVFILLLSAFVIAGSQVFDAQKAMHDLGYLGSASTNISFPREQWAAGPTPTPISSKEESDHSFISAASANEGAVNTPQPAVKLSGNAPRNSIGRVPINPAVQWAASGRASVGSGGSSEEDGLAGESAMEESLAATPPQREKLSSAGEDQRRLARLRSRARDGGKDPHTGSSEAGRNAYSSRNLRDSGLGTEGQGSGDLPERMRERKRVSERSGLGTREDEKIRQDYKSAYSHHVRRHHRHAEESNVGVASAGGSSTSSSGKRKKIETVHESDLGKPKKAKSAGSGEYLGSHLADGSSMVRGQNVTRLSYALYKIVRLFNMRKLADFPSSAHVEWMPEMVQRFEYDVPGFSYEGLDLTEEKVEKTRKAGDMYGSAEFRVADPEKEIPKDIADMILVWTELDGERTDPRSADFAQYIINVVKAAKKANVRYITFGQYPRLKGVAPIYSKGKWRFMDSREDPFLFNDHVRGVVPMASGANGYHLHLTLFSVRSFTEENLSF